MSEVPSELVLVWKELQVAWKTALDAWMDAGDDLAPVRQIAQQTAGRLAPFELEALIRHLSSKMQDTLLFVRLVDGYAAFLEVWIMEAIAEQGRRFGWDGAKT